MVEIPHSQSRELDFKSTSGRFEAWLMSFSIVVSGYLVKCINEYMDTYNFSAYEYT